MNYAQRLVRSYGQSLDSGYGHYPIPLYPKFHTGVLWAYPITHKPLYPIPAVQVLDVTGFLKYAVQSAAMFETRFNAVERLMAYVTLNQEAPRQIKDTQ